MNELSQYVLSRLGAGCSKAQVTEELQATGWGEEDIDRAYTEALIAMGAPVPDERQRFVAERKPATVDVVLNFFAFILLVVVSTAIGRVYFSVINLQLPDPLSQSLLTQAQGSAAIHYAIAALIISLPLLFLALRLWLRHAAGTVRHVESALTRWVTYLVLLIASVVIVGDLISVLYSFLQGELTLRFFLKALTVLVIASGILCFYFFERRMLQL